MVGAKTEGDAVEAIKAALAPNPPVNLAVARGAAVPTGVSPKNEEPPEEVTSDQDGEERSEEPKSFQKRVDKLTAKLKSETAEKEKLIRELGTLREQLSDAEDGDVIGDLAKKKPKGYDDWPLDRQNAWLASTVAKDVSEKRFGDLMPYLKTAATQIKVSKALGVNLTTEQAEAISEVLDDAPRLTPEEAMVVANSRNGELFKAQGGGKKLPASHSVVDPQRGGKSEPRSRDDRGKFIDKLSEGRPGSVKQLAVDHIQSLLTPKRRG